MEMIKRLSNNDQLIFFAVTMAVNAGNYGLNLFLGRYLGPEIFSEANVLATLVLMISFLGVAFQLTAAKFVAEQSISEAGLKRQLLQSGKVIGLILAALLMMVTPLLTSFFHFNSIFPLLLLFAGIPFYLIMSVKRGILQGQLKFNPLGRTYLVEMITRLLITVILVFTMKNMGIARMSEAIAIGFACSFIAGHYSGGMKIAGKKVIIPRLPAEMISFFVVILLYELCQILINNSDVLMVKHLFTDHEAGLYSATALIGRMIFFATWIMVTLLFPKVIQFRKAGKPTNGLFMMTLAGVAGCGIILTVICAWKGVSIITMLFGQDYAEIGHILWLYALATTLFASANVFVYYHLSLGRYLPVAISLAAGIFQVAGIYLYHGSLTEVIEVQIVIMTCLFAALVGYHTIRAKAQVSWTLIPGVKNSIKSVTQPI